MGWEITGQDAEFVRQCWNGGSIQRIDVSERFGLGIFDARITLKTGQVLVASSQTPMTALRVAIREIK